MALFSMLFGRFSRYISVRKLMIFWLLLIAISSCLLATLATTSPTYAITGSYLFILGAGMGLATPAIGVLVMKSVAPSRSLGMASCNHECIKTNRYDNGNCVISTLMIQQAINYMMIQSQALGIVAEPINIITLVTENKNRFPR